MSREDEVFLKRWLGKLAAVERRGGIVEVEVAILMR